MQLQNIDASIEANQMWLFSTVSITVPLVPDDSVEDMIR